LQLETFKGVDYEPVVAGQVLQQRRVVGVGSRPQFFSNLRNRLHVTRTRAAEAEKLRFEKTQAVQQEVFKTYEKTRFFTWKSLKTYRLELTLQDSNSHRNEIENDKCVENVAIESIFMYTSFLSTGQVKLNVYVFLQPSLKFVTTGGQGLI
jgi:hypothetical protein